MNDKPPFHSSTEELERLNTEVGEIKALLKEIAQRLGGIQRRVQRTLVIPKTSSATSGAGPKRKPRVPIEPPSITAEEALGLFDQLTSRWNEGARVDVEKQLKAMPLANLRLLAQELGISFSSNPSQKKLREGIMGRINERIMLSMNKNITKPLSTSLQNQTEQTTDKGKIE